MDFEILVTELGRTPPRMDMLKGSPPFYPNPARGNFLLLSHHHVNASLPFDSPPY
jgi:hypothetical protein